MQSVEPEKPARSAMGSRAAYQEAVRRWGMCAFIGKGKKGLCEVGYKVCGYPVVKGRGKTWALAFAGADKRGGKK